MVYEPTSPIKNRQVNPIRININTASKPTAVSFMPGHVLIINIQRYRYMNLTANPQLAIPGTNTVNQDVLVQ
jgi:hypothetical protein